MGSARHEQVLGHLPLEINAMVGRRQETTDLRQLLAAHRLVTLTGPGGIGKTRTALHLARSVRSTFADGAWFIDLSTVRDPALVPQVALESLKVPDTSAREALSVLTDHLRGRQVLLVLDNCEHLIGAAAGLVDAVLHEVAGTRFLATSRQPLGVPGEATYRLEPLAVPDASLVSSVQDISGFAAVELFTTRARAALGTFEVDASNHQDVIRLCARLEGLPLALELAASRLKVMTIDELYRRLDDRFGMLKGSSPVIAPRHQTLLAAVAWSHDLCTPAEQLLWRRASVFSGTFSLDAAETVCSGSDLPRPEVIDALLGLVDKSIVLNEPGNGRMRFRMLVTLRDFGQEKLAEAGESETLRAAHCAWTAALVAGVAAEWFGPRQAALTADLALDHASIRDALDFCATRPGHARTGQQMAGLVWFYWAVRGLSEGRLWLERLLAADTRPSEERTLALGTTGWVATLQGDTARGREAGVACEQLARELDLPVLVGYATHIQALAAFLGNHVEEAELLYPRARTLYSTVDAPPAWQLLLMVQYGAMRALQADVATAAALFQEIEADSDHHGDLWVRSYAVWGRGLASFHASDYDDAESSLLQSIAMKRPFRDILGLALALDVLAWVLAAKGDAARAARTVGAASGLWSTFGADLFGSDFFTARRAECEARARDALGDAAYDEAVRAGATATLDATLDSLLDHEPASRAPTSSRNAGSVLTRREREVARLVAEGLTNQEIADQLVISSRTAEGHVENVLRKLDVRSRTQIATWFATHEGPPAT